MINPKTQIGYDIAYGRSAVPHPMWDTWSEFQRTEYLEKYIGTTDAKVLALRISAKEKAMRTLDFIATKILAIMGDDESDQSEVSYYLLCMDSLIRLHEIDEWNEFMESLEGTQVVM